MLVWTITCVVNIVYKQNMWLDKDNTFLYEKYDNLFSKIFFPHTQDNKIGVCLLHDGAAYTNNCGMCPFQDH